MTPEDMHRLLDAHDQLARELREGGEAIRETGHRIRAALTRIEHVSATVRHATTAMLAANRAARERQRG